MTTRGQKDAERRILRAYMEARGIEGDVRDGPEPPDFVISVAGQTIGIEVIEYHQPERTGHGHTRREVEASWEAIRAFVRNFRETSRELDELSVLLTFKELHVPSRREIASFVRGVVDEIGVARPRISERFTYIRVGDTSPTVLRTYLRDIRVRECKCYMEWDWNHSFGGVGTSDDDMLSVIGRKLSKYAPPVSINTSRLVVTTDGVHISEVGAPFSVEQLQTFSELNMAIEASAFDEVFLYGYRAFKWTRDDGWTSVQLIAR